jgi:rhomboid protease GluP
MIEGCTVPEADNRLEEERRDKNDAGASAATPEAPTSFASEEREDPRIPSLQPLAPRRRGNLRVTISFSILLAIVYALTTAPSGFRHLSELAAALGSFYPPFVAQGQWWRFLTASLLHANPGHLFNNVFGIIVFGNLLEPVIGPGRLALLYAVSAVSGLGLSYFLLPHTPTIGASTIDFGLIGTYFALVLALRYEHNRRIFSEELRGAFFFVLVFVLWNSMENATINLWGHVGGLAAGVLFGLWVWTSRKKPLSE